MHGLTQLNARIRQVAILLVLMTTLPTAQSASVALKNKQGNSLFQEKKYEEAQKAYLEAQADAPDKPELLYNVGNALIKQKKYDQALQSLRQAIAKGDRGLQAGSWFNAGNALFEAGNFQDAAQAYIQSLRINPADREAKHNLELTLKKMREQQQNQQNPKQNQNKNDQQSSSDQDSQAGRKNQKPEPDKGPPQGDNSPDRQDSPKPANPQATKPDRREGSFNKERALQILDALQNQELAEQRKLLERRARRKATGKDW